MSITRLDLPFRPTPRPAAQPGKERANFAGASTNRLTSDWYAAIMSADRETRGSLRMLRARSRQFCRDNPHVAGLVGSFKDNIIGPSGIELNPRMRSPRGKLLKDTNLAVYAAFQRWGEREVCSADGQNSWVELQRLVLGTWFTDGEVLLRRLPGFPNPFSYTLQMLDVDQLDETLNYPASLGQNAVTQGVEIDKWGRPTAYHLWENHPNDPQLPRRRIRLDASDIIHLFQQLRPNQRRGIPILTPVLIALKMLDGYTQAEVTAAWVAAAQGGFFTMTGQDALDHSDADADGEDATLAIEMEAEPGLARKLPKGWKFEKWDPSHPNSTFPEFQRSMLRVIARGCNTSYITISGDLSDTSYSSGRVGLIAERDAYKAIQSWFGTRIVVPVYRDVLRYGSLTGEIILPTPEASKWSDCQLEPRGWPWVDPKNDAETAEIELACFLNSPQRICASRGIDFEEILDELQEAQGLAKERGLEWPQFGAGRSPNAVTNPTPGPPAKTPAGKPAALSNGNGNGHHNRVADILGAE